jgi:hypothetical protein
MKLLNILENFGEGAEPLVVRILQLVTEDTRPSRELTQGIIKAFYQERNLTNFTFMGYVFTGLESKSDIIMHLPKLVSCLDATDARRRFVKDILVKILDPKASTAKGVSGTLITPAEILVAIHNMDDDAVTLKQRIEG